MRLRGLGFRDLQYIVAVSECGSFSKAALACAISQPALSERIKGIESVLGVELYERNKRKIKVTPVGEQLVSKARELLDGVAEIDEIVSNSMEPLTGILRVGVIATLGPYLMPILLPQLKNKYPKLELVLQEGFTDTLLSSLHLGTLDLLIASSPINTMGIEQCALFHEPFVLAVPKEHKFAKRKRVNSSELLGEDMVLLEDAHCLTGQALDICPARKRGNLNRLHAMTLETLRHMVATGAGYTLMPSLAVGDEPLLTDLISYITLSGKQRIGREIILAWRQSFTRGEDIELFARLIQDSVKICE